MVRWWGQWGYPAFAGVAVSSGTVNHPLIIEDVVMESSPDLIPGQTLAVFYEDDTLWHERLLLWRLNDGCWFVLTPDLDIYAEDVSGSGVDGPSRVKVKGQDFRYWSRVGGASYRFAAPVADDASFQSYVRKALIEARKEADFDEDWRPTHFVDTKGVVQDAAVLVDHVTLVHRLNSKGPAVRRGQGGGVVSQPVVAHDDDDDRRVQAILPPSSTQAWIITENMDSYRVGDPALVNPRRDIMIGSHTGLIKTASGWVKAELVEAGEAVDFTAGRRALAQPAASHVPLSSAEKPAGGAEETSSDARTLMVDYDHQGVRYKEWRAVVSESRDFAYEDWPCEGPATVLHLLKHMYKYGGDPKQWLELWCRQKGIAEQDRVKHELRCLMDILYLGGTYDQLNMPVLASFETASRRVQCIVDAYAAGGGVPDWGNAKLFTGYQTPEDLVMPQLRTWAARRGKEEVELYHARHRMRELRKPGSAAEEAAAAVADGSLPAGGPAPKPKRRPRGKGLDPPAAAT